jgi:small subunit ribosomal protein S16
MLTIRMQRTGRKGHAMFRVVVQESRLTPTSGKVVAQLGSYDPHAKVAILNKEKATFYLGHGAQPSDRAARLLQGEGVKLPTWVKLAENKTGKLRNPEKLRKNQPKETQPEKLAEEAATTDKAESPTEVEA